MDDSVFAFLSSICSSEEIERQREEIVFHSTEDIFAPFYWGELGYTPQMEKDKIKTLSAHYYYYGEV